MGNVFLEATHLRARKAHQCELCNRWVAIGETYRRQGVVWDGCMFTTITCAHCEQFCQALFDAGFEGDEGGWPYPAELDDGEVASVGLLQEMRLFRDRWQRNGVLVEYPASPNSEEADRG
jgi:hypothetical protein